MKSPIREKQRFFTLVLTGALVFWWFKARSAKSPTTSPAHAYVTSKDLFARPISPVRKNNAPARDSPKPPPECEESWAVLSETDTATIERLLGQNLFPLDESCLKASKKITGDDKSGPEACRPFYASNRNTPTELKPKQRKVCTDFLTLYRARIIDFLVPNKSPLSSMESSVLMNKILAGFAVANMDAAAIKQNLELSRALTEREPNLYAGQKALAVAQFLDSELNHDVASGAALNDTLAKAEALNAKDPTLFELKLLPKLVHGQDEAAAEMLADYARQNPNSAIPVYYAAHTAWKNGDRAKTIELLQRCVALQPDYAPYGDSLAKARTAPPKAEIFSLATTFDFENI